MGGDYLNILGDIFTYLKALSFKLFNVPIKIFNLVNYYSQASQTDLILILGLH